MPSRAVIESAKALVGATVRGKWHLDGLLGVGGSAAVYAATHRNGKRGALKILRRDLAYDRETQEQFLREGYVANLVGHPGAVAMLDDDLDDDGTPFLVMELLEGSTLERLLRKRKSMPLRDVLRIAESVLDVLGAAHAQGIVHGDVKPANVFLTTQSEVKLLDFGVARVGERPPKPESRGGPQDALGTPAYMSPEQARGERIDGRTDLWALGAVMFSLLTGKPPRSAPTPREELVMAAIDPVPKLKDVAPWSSDELAEVVDRALAFDLWARWPDAETMQQALRLALLLEQASGPPEHSMQVPPPPKSSFPKSPVPEALRLLRPDFKPSDSSLPTRRLPVEPPVTTGRVSTFPPSPSTTNRLAFAAARASSMPPDATSGDRRGSRRMLIAVALVIAALAGGTIAFRPLLEVSIGSSAATAEPEATDAGVRDGSFADVSR